MGKVQQVVNDGVVKIVIKHFRGAQGRQNIHDALLCSSNGSSKDIHYEHLRDYIASAKQRCNEAFSIG